MPLIQHERSDYLPKLEALHRRLPARHPLRNKINDELIKEKTGLKGENDVQYMLRFLPPDDHYHHRNPRIPCTDSHFEIDNLLMYPMLFLAVEVKNWYGTIFFDGDKQVIRRDDNGVDTGMLNPIPQVKLQMHRLRLLLNKMGLPHIPLHYFVVFSSPKTIIKPLYPETPVSKKVIHANQLFFKINELLKENTSLVLGMDTIAKISDRLIEEHTPKKVDILDKFGIKPSELIHGVFCPACDAAPMKREYGKWRCPFCRYVSKNAHLAALNDYLLLVSDVITNAEARAFLMVESADIVKKILQKEYACYGTNRSRKYMLKLKY
ncbi:nuclease-related domain-containing protein [Virgibacillus ihumii]|uniref:nuclease-related domain-containing protein n=1 Tax=Virgibacillus ihumii TaxID=2686091 RepID=UPI00157C4BA6|nr:nuclease-related domain-containing protein [Virgibacillus ihumii]